MEVSGSSIISGIKWTSSSAIIKMILGLALNVYLARNLGLELWGILTVLITLSTILIQISNVFINGAIIYFASKYEGIKQKSYVTWLFIYKLIFVILIAAVFFVFSNDLAIAFKSQEYAKYFQVFILYFVSASVFNTFQSISYGVHLFKTGSLIDLAGTICKFGLVIWLVSIGFAVKGAAIGMIAATGIGVLGMLWITREFFTLHPKKINTKEVLGYNLHLGATNLFGIIMAQTDLFMIGLLMGPTPAGIYNIAVLVVVSLSTIFSTLTNVLIPSFTKLAKQKEKLEKFFKESMYYGFSIAIPMTFGIIITAPFIVNFFFGLEYMGAVPVMAILSYILIDMIVVSCFSAYLIAQNKIKIISTTYIFASVLNLFLDFFFILWWGIIGAAVATIISKIFMYIFAVYWHNKDSKAKIGMPLKTVINPFIASFAMVFALNFIKPFVTDYTTLTLFILAGIAIYSGVQYLLGFNFKRAIKIITGRI